jgi:hypothetical protein
MKQKEELKLMKVVLNDVPLPERTVKVWNSQRELLKELFSKEAIALLDASAFINIWLKEEGINSKTIVNQNEENEPIKSETEGSRLPE